MLLRISLESDFCLPSHLSSALWMLFSIGQICNLSRYHMMSCPIWSQIRSCTYVYSEDQQKYRRTRVTNSELCKQFNIWFVNCVICSRRNIVICVFFFAIFIFLDVWRTKRLSIILWSIPRLWTYRPSVGTHIGKRPGLRWGTSVQYCGGCSVPWGDILRIKEDVQHQLLNPTAVLMVSLCSTEHSQMYWWYPLKYWISSIVIIIDQRIDDVSPKTILNTP